MSKEKTNKSGEKMPRQSMMRDMVREAMAGTKGLDGCYIEPKRSRQVEHMSIAHHPKKGKS